MSLDHAIETSILKQTMDLGNQSSNPEIRFNLSYAEFPHDPSQNWIYLGITALGFTADAPAEWDLDPPWVIEILNPDLEEWGLGSWN